MDLKDERREEQRKPNNIFSVDIKAVMNIKSFLISIQSLITLCFGFSRLSPLIPDYLV